MTTTTTPAANTFQDTPLREELLVQWCRITDLVENLERRIQAAVNEGTLDEAEWNEQLVTLNSILNKLDGDRPRLS